jgi:hypothetical protein
MSCTFLLGRQIKMCGAFKATLVLSVEELDSKCNTEMYHLCHLYQKCMKSGAKLPLQEYKVNYRLPQV